jgi:hypothetical protein
VPADAGMTPPGADPGPTPIVPLWLAVVLAVAVAVVVVVLLG